MARGVKGTIGRNRLKRATDRAWSVSVGAMSHIRIDWATTERPEGWQALNDLLALVFVRSGYKIDKGELNG